MAKKRHGADSDTNPTPAEAETPAETPAETVNGVLLADGVLPLMTRAQASLIDAAAAIWLDPEPTDADRAFLARQLVQVTLPHSNPGNVPIWERKNGKLTLSIRPGWNHRKKEPIGYPYGSIPRLLLYWINTEVVRTGARRLELGDSVAGFMREVGLNPETGRGQRGDAKRLQEQMLRLFRSTISFNVTEGDEKIGGDGWLDMQIAPAGEMWWDHRQPDQRTLFGSWIELGEKFYQAIVSAPVPLNMVALKALKRSPMALDLYAWATYRTFTVSRTGKPTFIPWRGLAAQLGADYADSKNAKKAMQAALKKVQLVYPALHIEDADGGFLLLPSRSSVSPRFVTKS